MAWEWVEPTATGVVAVAGIAGTLWSGRLSRTSAERIAQETHERAMEAAREQRRQERLAVAYVEVLQIAESVGHWAQSFGVVMDRAEPPLPPLAEQVRARALLLAHGSPDVRAAHHAWASVVDQINLAASNVARDRAERDSTAEDRRRLGLELAPVERERRRELAREIAGELAPDG
jgi:hypothetical protein